jgi:hypothetical protein
VSKNNNTINKIDYYRVQELTFNLFYNKLSTIENFTINLNNNNDDYNISKFKLYTRLNNIYKDVYSNLDIYRYNNKRLSTLLTPYNPHEIADTLLNIIYNKKLTTQQQNKRVHLLLSYNSYKYYMRGIANLTEKHNNNNNNNNNEINTKENN